MENVYDFSVRISKIEKLIPYKPNWEKPKEGTIYDEDKSVRWNKEKYEEELKRWIEEERQLKVRRMEARNEVYEDLYTFIEDDIGVTREAAKRMWERSDHNFSTLECMMNDYAYIKEVDA